MTKAMAYPGISAGTRDIGNQKFEIPGYTNSRTLAVNGFIEVEVSRRKDIEDRRVEHFLSTVQTGDIVLSSELLRLGRSIKTAEKIERATDLVSITCGINAAGGLVSIPCLSVQAVNLASGIFGWFFKRTPVESPEAPQTDQQGSESQVFDNDQLPEKKEAILAVYIRKPCGQPSTACVTIFVCHG